MNLISIFFTLAMFRTNDSLSSVTWKNHFEAPSLLVLSLYMQLFEMTSFIVITLFLVVLM